MKEDSWGSAIEREESKNGQKVQTPHQRGHMMTGKNMKGPFTQFFIRRMQLLPGWISKRMIGKNQESA